MWIPWITNTSPSQQTVFAFQAKYIARSSTAWDPFSCYAAP